MRAQRPTIFEGLKQADEHELAYIIAVMKHQTTLAITKEQAVELAVKAKGLFNATRRFFGNKSVPTAQRTMELHKENHEGLEKKIQHEVEELLAEYDRSRLYLLFISTLEKYLGMEGKSLQEISDKAILKAAEGSKLINQDLTIEEKADEIYRITNVGISQNLNNMSSEEIRELDKCIDIELKNLSSEKRVALEKTFNTRNITAEMVRSSVIRGGLSVGVLTLGTGFSSYIFLTTMIHAVFTTLLGVTLPFAAYTAATSGLGMVFGPVGWSAIGVAFTYKAFKMNKKVKASILSIMTYLSMVNYGQSFVTDEEGNPVWFTVNSNEFKQYKDQEQTIKRLKAKLAILEDEISCLNDSKYETNALYLRKEIQANVLAEKVTKAKGAYKKAVADKEKNDIIHAYQVKYEELTAEYNLASQELQRIQEEKVATERELSDKQKIVADYSKQVETLEESQEKLLQENVSLREELENAKVTLKVTKEKLEETEEKLEVTEEKLEDTEEQLDEANKKARVHLVAAKVFGRDKIQVYDAEARVALGYGIAHAKEEVAISVPFISKGALYRLSVGDSALIDLLRKALERNVRVIICVGYGTLTDEKGQEKKTTASAENGDRLRKAIEIMDDLKMKFKKYHGKTFFVKIIDDHSKIVIIDRKYEMQGSYNALSWLPDFKKNQGGGETVSFIGDQASVDEAYERFFEPALKDYM